MTRTLRWLVISTGLVSAACKSPTGGHHGGGGGAGVASVAVSPPTACLTVGQTMQLTTIAKDSAGNVLTGYSVTWTTNNAGVATVSATGLVTGVAAGSATITASHKQYSATAGIALQTGTAIASLRTIRFHLAIGDGGAMLTFDGVHWNPVCSGTTSDLHAIIRNGLGALFIAGSEGTILQYDTISGGWSARSSATTSTLYGLSRAPAAFMGTLYAVGAGGTIVHYDGTNWTAQRSGTTSALFSVAKVPGYPAAYAVGAGGTILHNDNTGWSTKVSGTTSDLFWVTVADTGDVYAFGAGGTIVHYDGSHWSSIPVTGLTATLRAADYTVDTLTGAVTGYFVVGDGGTILHSSDGVHWSPQASGTTNDLFGLLVASDSNAVAVGAMGTILRYNGVTWSKER